MYFRFPTLGQTAWTPPSLPGSIVLLGAGLIGELVPGIRTQTSRDLGASSAQSFYYFFPDGSSFVLEHDGRDACGIPDKETLVLTGGSEQNHVTRWEHICIMFVTPARSLAQFFSNENLDSY